MTQHPTQARGIRRHARRGFTFMEILFAVMILGIGFIMVAAMFPAALQQTQAAVDENQYNSVVRIASETMRQLGYALDNNPATTGNPPTPVQPVQRLLDVLTSARGDSDRVAFAQKSGFQPSQMPGSRPVVYSFHDARLIPPNYGVSATISDNAELTRLHNHNPYAEMWDLVRGNVILPDNPQYAWVPLWSREFLYSSTGGGAGTPGYSPVPFMRLMIFPVRARAKSQYDGNPTVLINPGGTTAADQNPNCDITFSPSNLDPVPVGINYYPPTSAAPFGVIQVKQVYKGPDWIGNPIQLTSGSTLNPVAAGSYVILSDNKFGSSGTIITDPVSNKNLNLDKSAFNGTVFHIGNEVTDASGNGTSSGGLYWAVASIDYLPTGVTNPSQINANSITSAANQPFPLALCIGRGPDPAQVATQYPSAQQRETTGKFVPLPRAGQAQELGLFPYSISFVGN